MVLVVLVASHVFAQSGATLVGAAYSFPGPVVAPGQIIQLQVTGLTTVLSPSIQKATSVPLPTMLAGISVTVNQLISQCEMCTPVQVPYAAPLVSLEQVNSCFVGTTPDCLTTFIAIQIPYELQIGETQPPIIQTQIVITENGLASQAFNVGAQFDQVHVVTTCEDQPGQTGCPSIVAHADGTLVSALSPAQPNETVVIYAWGLGGLPTNAVKTGNATAAPAPAVQYPGQSPGNQGLLLRLDFSPNAAPSRYFPTVSYTKAYLTPGFVGLYQVNVQLPATFPAVPACGQGVQSNLTIDLGGPSSFDGAAICVQPVQ